MHVHVSSMTTFYVMCRLTMSNTLQISALVLCQFPEERQKSNAARRHRGHPDADLERSSVTLIGCTATRSGPEYLLRCVTHTKDRAECHDLRMRGSVTISGLVSLLRRHGQVYPSKRLARNQPTKGLRSRLSLNARLHMPQLCVQVWSRSLP